jgi:hypothetical protein
VGRFLFLLLPVLVDAFMANTNKPASGGEESLFGQLASLLREVSGEQPDLRVNVENLKLNLGKAKVVLNGKVELVLPPAQTQRQPS